jgi:hypothetical protein
LTKNVICVTIPKYHAISLKKFHLLELWYICCTWEYFSFKIIYTFILKLLFVVFYTWKTMETTNGQYFAIIKKTKILHTWSFYTFFWVQIEASMQLVKFWFVVWICIFSQLLCYVFCMIWLNTNIYMFYNTLCMFFACWFSISSWLAFWL